MYYIRSIRDTLVLGQKTSMMHLQVLTYNHRYLCNVYVVQSHLHGVEAAAAARYRRLEDI